MLHFKTARNADAKIQSVFKASLGLSKSLFDLFVAISSPPKNESQVGW
jgi:hypothetical protein